MIKIRLSREGSRNNPFYRVVAVDEQRKRSGKSLDVIGYWHPAKNDKKIDKKKLNEWIDKGAMVTKAVEKLL